MPDQKPEAAVAPQEDISLKKSTSAKKQTKAQKKKADKGNLGEIINPTRRPGFYDQYAFSSVMGGFYKPYDRQPAGRPKKSKLPKLGEGLNKAHFEEDELSPQTPDGPNQRFTTEKKANDYNGEDGEDDGKWQMGNGIGSRPRHQLSRDVPRPKGWWAGSKRRDSILGNRRC